MASAATPPAAHSTPPPQDRRPCDRIPEATHSSAGAPRATADDLKKSDATSLRWRSAGGSETVLQILDAVLGPGD